MSVPAINSWLLVYVWIVFERVVTYSVTSVKPTRNI
jgi:hypothetical protein